MNEILMRDLPNFMSMISPEDDQKGEKEFNPFEEEDAEWDIPKPFRDEMKQIWNTLSPSGDRLGGGQLRQTMLETKAPQEHLKRIWTLSDIDKSGKLDEDEFILAMHLAHQAAAGNPPPSALAERLIPPSKRIDKNALFSQ